MWTRYLVLVQVLLAASSFAQSNDESLPTVVEKVGDSMTLDGFLKFTVDQQQGTIWLHLPPPAGPDGLVGEYIYVNSIRSGLGSNPVGIDRGQLGETRLVRIRRIGPKVIIEQANLRFRALSESEVERRAVAESFASSALWGGEIGALDADGSAIVDIGGFLTRDAHAVRNTLRQTGQGDFTLDSSRSFVNLDHCLSFPDNAEFEATVTYTSDRPGIEVRSTAAEPSAVTLVQRHAFIRLPDAGYVPREADPRIASFAIEFLDYASPLAEPLKKRWIVRHRLARPAAAANRAAPGGPIVYYVDSAAPEPIRSALIDGASWWADAFAAAGLEGAFRVEVLPEGVHPLDVRYNVIQWVHRSTRGWSYGGSIVDPRTGEIIKGHVSLGSLRVRQDRMIFEGLLGTDGTGSGAADDPVELALARIRQLSAHEVGHTLGFAHNFAASTYDGRASVMDYPAPLVTLRDDRLNVADAYATGIGSWDRLCVRYAYSTYPDPAAERDGLSAIIQEATLRHRFMSDADARPAGAAHPLASLWDNGDDPVRALGEALAVRARAIETFDQSRLRAGDPVARLEEVFVPVYFYHRYQMEAAAKSIGGVLYVYAVNGDRRTPIEPVSADAQRRALETVLRCLSVETLAIPDRVVNTLAPRAFGMDRHPELFMGRTGAAFDPTEAAATAADMVLMELFQPERCARVLEHHRRDGNQMSLDWMVDQVIAAGLHDVTDDRLAPISGAVRNAIVNRLILLASNPETAPMVRAVAESRLQSLANRLIRTAAGQPGSLGALHESLARRINTYLERDVTIPFSPATPAPAPPGSPIGIDYLGGCASTG